MHVAADEQVEFVVADLDQFEVLALGDIGSLGEGVVELGEYALARDHITAGYDHEYVFPFLLGLYLVDALVVGADNLVAVGDQYVGYSLAVAKHYAVDGCAWLGVDRQGSQDVEVEGSDIIVDSVAADIHLVVAAGHAVGKLEGQPGAVLDGYDGAGVVDAGAGTQDNLVGFLDVGRTAELEIDRGPFFYFKG